MRVADPLGGLPDALRQVRVVPVYPGQDHPELPGGPPDGVVGDPGAGAAASGGGPGGGHCTRKDTGLALLIVLKYSRFTNSQFYIFNCFAAIVL